eukprot:gene40315-49857_t
MTNNLKRHKDLLARQESQLENIEDSDLAVKVSDAPSNDEDEEEE